MVPKIGMTLSNCLSTGAMNEIHEGVGLECHFHTNGSHTKSVMVKGAPDAIEEKRRKVSTYRYLCTNMAHLLCSKIYHQSQHSKSCLWRLLGVNVPNPT